MASEKLIDIKIDPTRTDLRVFAILWAAFFVVVGVLAFATEWFLLKVAGVTGACFVVSMLLNRDYPRAQQRPGAIIPLGFLAIWLFEYVAHNVGGAFFTTRTGIRGLSWPVGDGAQWTAFFAVGALGVSGMLAMLASRAVATRLYRGWMFAALPIGWTFSHIILGAVFYLVITPIGLILRLLGYNPLMPQPDRAAPTYWLDHPQEKDPKRYFRQF